jgi:serine phosphatase RsbU (regulator of sigma subunit)
MFVTFFLGLVDLETGHLDFCNAGHNPPVLITNSELRNPNDANSELGIQNSEFMDMLPNAPIGLFPGLEYEGEQIDNIKGRPLFIYTDGLNEAENLQQEQFGDDRLLSILRTIPFDSAQQVIETLKVQVEAHRNGAEPNDDLTMMCLKVE